MALFGKEQNSGFGGSVYAKPILPALSQTKAGSLGSSSSGSTKSSDIELEGLKGQMEAFMMNENISSQYRSKAFSRGMEVLEKTDGDLSALNNDETFRRLNNAAAMIDQQQIVNRQHLKNIKEDFDETQKDIKKLEAQEQYFFNNGQRMWINTLNGEIISQANVDKARADMSNLEYEDFRRQYRPMKVSDYDKLQFMPNSSRDEKTGVYNIEGIMSPEYYDESDGNPFDNVFNDMLNEASEHMETNKSGGYNLNPRNMASLMRTGIIMGGESSTSHNYKAIQHTLNNFMNQMDAGQRKAMRDQFYRSGYEDSPVNVMQIAGIKSKKDFAKSPLSKVYGDLMNENGEIEYNENDDYNTIRKKRQAKQQLFVLAKGRALAGTYQEFDRSSKSYMKGVSGYGPGDFDRAGANIYSTTDVALIRRVRSGQIRGTTSYYTEGVGKDAMFNSVETVVTETQSPFLAKELNDNMPLTPGNSGMQVQSDHIVINGTGYGKKQASPIFQNARILNHTGRFRRANAAKVANGKVVGYHDVDENGAGTQMYSEVTIVISGRDIKDNNAYAYPDQDEMTEGGMVPASPNMRKGIYKYPSNEANVTQGWDKYNGEVLINGKEVKKAITVKAWVPIGNSVLEANQTMTPNDDNTAQINQGFNGNTSAGYVEDSYAENILNANQ